MTWANNFLTFDNNNCGSGREFCCSGALNYYYFMFKSRANKWDGFNSSLIDYGRMKESSDVENGKAGPKALT